MLAIASATTLVASLDRPQDPVPAAAKKFDVTAASCGSCHTEIHAEWEGRMHHMAWDDEIYQADIAEKSKKKQCYPCHIPQSVLDRLGKRPRTRDDHHGEGVTCVSCHEQDGVIHGPYGAKTDAHPTAKHEAFSTEGSSKLCASCHKISIADVIGVAKDWEKVYSKQPGAMTCVECHMPEKKRPLAVDPQTGQPSGPERMTRQHVVLGPRDSEFCAEAFELSGRKDGGQVVLAIENLAGHRIPGLKKLRVFSVQVQLQDTAGKKLTEYTVELTGKDGLPVAETRDFSFQGAPGATQLGVKIDHLLNGEKLNTVLEQTVTLK